MPAVLSLPWCAVDDAIRGPVPRSRSRVRCPPAQAALVAKHGEKERPRVDVACRQAARVCALGTATRPLSRLRVEEFLPQGETLDLTFARMEYALDDGRVTSASLARDLRSGADLSGAAPPLDGRLAASTVGPPRGGPVREHGSRSWPAETFR
jgi:hypothetical protein